MSTADGYRLGKGLLLGSDAIASDFEDGDGHNVSSARNGFVAVSEINLPKVTGFPILTTPDGIKYIFGQEAIAAGLALSSPLQKSPDIITPTTTKLADAAVALSSNFLEKPRRRDEYVYFSVPTIPLDTDSVEIEHGIVANYHSAFYARALSRLGYRALPMPEGQAIALNENDSASKSIVGISFGMSFINVSIVSHNRLLRSFTLSKAGNWILQEVSLELKLPIPKIEKMLKCLDLCAAKTDLELTIRSYYRQAIDSVLDYLEVSFVSIKSQEDFSMVWAGPMTLPGSFADLARERWNQRAQEKTFPGNITEQKRSLLPGIAVVSGLRRKANSEYVEL